MNKLHMINIVLSSTNNPILWTDSDLSKLTRNEVVVGYLLKSAKIESDYRSILNLYIIDADQLLPTHKIINALTLKHVFLQWTESLAEDSRSFMFRNPPLDKWLETKRNWVKKITGILSATYYKTYDDCLSTLYTTILVCYNRGDIYIGNLHYLVVATNNRLKMDHRYMKNRLTGEHKEAVHLDAAPSDFNNDLENSISSLHEIIGGVEDPYIKEYDTYEIFKSIKTDLLKEFSEREIDQIVNAPGYLPNTLYRKLLKWRKSHKKEDYL